MNPLDLVKPDLTDPQSVAANRRGELTPAQQARLSNPLSALIGTGPGVLGLNLLRQAAHLQQDLHAPRIQSAQGQLVLQAQGYFADIAGQCLPLPADRGQLLPGITYQFYYLPESGAILSAEALYSPGEAALREQLTGLLAQALHYEVGALDANRQGKLANAQAPRLYRSFVLGLILLAITAGVMALFLVTFLKPPNLTLVVRLLGIVVAVLLGGLFGWVGFGLTLRAALDLLASRVEFVDGVVHKKIKSSGRRRASTSLHGRASLIYYYEIDRKRFQVSECAYQALIENRAYRLYYAPHSQALVGVEPL